MAVRDPATIRNLVLVGQSGAGKTTLVERLLADTGTINRMGSVEDGNTVSDWTDEEKHHKHSLRPSLVHFEHDGSFINLIDTPGLGDFLGHTIACYPGVETVCLMIDPTKGVDSITRRLMKVAAERKLPRMIVINHIDGAHIDGLALETLVEQIRSTLGNECLPINLPEDGGAKVENVFEHEHAEGPNPDFSSVEDAHQAILEQVVEVDESLTEAYFEGDKLDPKKLHDAFERCMREGHLVPICFASAKTGAGIPDLLHVMTAYMPSPLEGNPRPFFNTNEDGTETQVTPEPDAEAHTLAHVFQVSSDPFVGKLGVFRVHQGTVKAKGDLYIGDGKKGVRIGHLFRLQGKDHVEVSEIGPGDIGAVSKIEEIAFDSVLHDDHASDHVHLKPLPLPRPMFGLAVELKDHKDETKFATAMHKLTIEDPSLTMERIEATKQTVMRGLGELHLRVVMEKLKEQFGIELTTETPKVAYKETVASKGEGHHRHKKQSGGSGEFAEVYLRVEPFHAEPGTPEPHFEFVNGTVGGSILRQFMPAVEKGVRQALAEGAIAGYPMTGVRVEVYDGKHHAVDSKEVAFIKAGKRAFIDAVKKAKPSILEPFVQAEITIPSGYVGDITGDISTKRGRVVDTQIIGSDTAVIVAGAPLGELQNYTTELKSLTGGAGSFTLGDSHDEQAPPHVQQEVIAAYQPHEED